MIKRIVNTALLLLSAVSISASESTSECNSASNSPTGSLKDYIESVDDYLEGVQKYINALQFGADASSGSSSPAISASELSKGWGEVDAQVLQNSSAPATGSSSPSVSTLGWQKGWREIDERVLVDDSIAESTSNGMSLAEMREALERIAPEKRSPIDGQALAAFNNLASGSISRGSSRSNSPTSSLKARVEASYRAVSSRGSSPVSRNSSPHSSAPVSGSASPTWLQASYAAVIRPTATAPRDRERTKAGDGERNRKRDEPRDQKRDQPRDQGIASCRNNDQGQVWYNNASTSGNGLPTISHNVHTVDDPNFAYILSGLPNEHLISQEGDRQLYYNSLNGTYTSVLAPKEESSWCPLL